MHNQLHSILTSYYVWYTCHTCSYQITILVLTFCLYASLHMARMTSSVVKVTSLQVHVSSSMRHGQPSCGFIPPGGFTQTGMECLCDPQSSQFNWISVTMYVHMCVYSYVYVCVQH